MAAHGINLSFQRVGHDFDGGQDSVIKGHSQKIVYRRIHFNV
jgi:hypothetical protein